MFLTQHVDQPLKFFLRDHDSVVPAPRPMQPRADIGDADTPTLEPVNDRNLRGAHVVQQGHRDSRVVPHEREQPVLGLRPLRTVKRGERIGTTHERIGPRARGQPLLAIPDV
jgi:hypothetical protein